jgi:23S rRNA (uracil1939-C5)-methyltransferase
LPRVSAAAGGTVPETVCQLRPALITLSDVQVSPPPGAFLQATAEGERAIVEAVLSGLPAKITSKSRVAELYAGCGTLTFALAKQARVTAFEGDTAAFTALRRAVNQAALVGRVEAFQRDLARQPLSARELSGYAAVVQDPPHAGAAAQVAQIAASGVATVIYVSCNPATLSRDARTLHAAGYRLAAATGIDQFLWSPRLESVCVFRRG